MDAIRCLDQYPIFSLLQQLAEEQKVEAYVIGGFVRDWFLGRPSKDIDIVCIGDGIALAQGLAQKSPRQTIKIYKRFGTACVRSKGWEIEFVGARKESYTFDSRKPLVSSGTLEDDQRRRDFTINALAISLNKKNYGKLLDPFGGLQDLADKRIRTPLAPDKTFSDDPLRMLRAIRFSAQLAFSLAPATAAAIQDQAHRLKIVSMERIMGEFHKILLSPRPSQGLLQLDALGLLPLFLPELVALKGVDRIGRWAHKDNFLHTLQVVDNTAQRSEDLWLRWAALLHDIAKPQTKRFKAGIGFTFHGHEELGARMIPQLFRRLRLPLHQKMRYVKKLVRLHLRPIALAQEGITDSAVRRLLFEAGQEIDDLMKLCRADITSKNERKAAQYLSNFDLVEEKIAQVKAKDYVRTLQPAIDGHAIMTTFGLGPGPTVGKIRQALKEALLSGQIANDPERLYAYMLKVGQTHGLEPIQPPKSS